MEPAQGQTPEQGPGLGNKKLSSRFMDPQARFNVQVPPQASQTHTCEVPIRP